MQKRVIFSTTCGSLKTSGAAAAVLTAACVLAAPVQAQQLWSKTFSMTAAEASNFAPPPRDAAVFEAEMAREVMAAANRARAQQGLGPLSGDPALDSVAAAYSRKMLGESFFGHVAPDGSNLKSRLGGHMQRLGRAAENLWTARGKIDWRPSGVSQQAVENWLDSPGHRRNLLEGEFVTAGVGVAQRGDAIYVTMLYGAAGSGASGSTLVASAGQAPSAPGPAPMGFGSSFEASALSAINAARGRNGLAPLNADARLANLARARSQEMGRGGGLNADGGLLGQVGSSTGARRVAATVWRGDNVQWSPETLAQTMMDTWARDPSNMRALLDGAYGSVGLGVEVVDGGVRLAAIFTDGAASGGSTLIGAPASFGASTSGYAANQAAPLYAPAPVQVAQAAAPIYDVGLRAETLQTGSVGVFAAPTQQFASLPVYEPGDAGVNGSLGRAAAPVYEPAPVLIAHAPIYSPTPRAAPIYEPAPVQLAQAPVYEPAPVRVAQAPVYEPAPVRVSVERRMEAPVAESGSRGGWVTRRVVTTTTVVADGGLGGLFGVLN